MNAPKQSYILEFDFDERSEVVLVLQHELHSALPILGVLRLMSWVEIEGDTACELSPCVMIHEQLGYTSVGMIHLPQS